MSDVKSEQGGRERWPGAAGASGERRSTILLVDDEELVREELGGILSDEGYAVLAGADGEEGLELLRSAAPDFVITDVRMPRRDGLALALVVRQEKPAVPVTVITGHGNEKMAIEALRAGVIDFIKKPVHLEDLRAALQRMEAARRLARLEAEPLPEGVLLLEQSFVFELRTDLSAVPDLVELLLRRCAAGAERRWALELSLALRELLVNAIEHGNLGLSYAEKSRALEKGTLGELLEERASDPGCARRRVRVKALRRAREVTVSIADEGAGFDWRRLAAARDAAQLFSEHGRGVLLARLSADSIVYNEAGNEVTITKIL